MQQQQQPLQVAAQDAQLLDAATDVQKPPEPAVHAHVPHAETVPADGGQQSPPSQAPDTAALAATIAAGGPDAARLLQVLAAAMASKQQA